ncbi:putative phosphopantetheine adenylyltransferase/dephospho-CoA kinase [Paratrimastix pyriformis]|uniref:Phosphopantetheine adenylyltransferase/dephospho-CoA kinase n=1 Tax=Paratrimastix pyriformis TaxID=342808 RepID=A0ABQ8UV58_9EUKA|nr:putative phosphopantetheine adenylyltransferase/dephospho-CoA kinase [Paratrimastix pyriformis]
MVQCVSILTPSDGKATTHKFRHSSFNKYSKFFPQRRLCDISWPRIMELFQQRIDRLVAEDPENPRKNPLFVVMEAAILIEAGWVGGVDEVWVVVTDPEVACQRLMARNSLSRDEALRRIGAQMSNEEKAKYARVVIHNDANLPTVEAAMALLESQVRAEWDALLDRTK